MKNNNGKNHNKSSNDQIKIFFAYYGIRDVILENKGHGGAEVQLFLLANELSKSNKYSIIIPNYGKDSKELEKHREFKIISFSKKELPEENDIQKKNKLSNKLKRYITWRFNQLSNFLKIASAFIKANPDIIITRTASKKIFRYMLVSKILRKKFIFMIAHDWDCNGEYERRNRENDQFYREGVIGTDLIVCQNEYQKKELKKNYDRDSIRINSMYPVPDIKEKKRKYILWVGRCETWKRPEAFIELARCNPEQKFLMISACARNEKKYYNDIMERAKKTGNIEFKEYVPFSKMDKVFQEAIMFVNTSTYEGFPNTFIQSAKNKTPVLSLNVKPNDLFKKYEIGICADDDMQKFKKSFKKMINDKSMLSKLGNNGFRYAREKHDIEKIVRIYDGIFSSLKQNKRLNESDFSDSRM